MTAEEPPVSPRLVALQAELEAGNSDALAVFWREISSRGTPLVETIPGDDKYALLTFLWRAQEKLKNVVVFSHLSHVRGTYEINQLAHLPGTDLWYRTDKVRSDARSSYFFSLNDPLTDLQSDDDLGIREAGLRKDPLNKLTIIEPRDEENPNSKEQVHSILAMPAAPPQPWLVHHMGVATGHVKRYRLNSASLGHDFSVWVYTPPHYHAKGTPYPMLLLFDGWAYRHTIPTPTILDNLIAAKKIPPLVAVMLQHPDFETRNRELPCQDPFFDYITQEFVPWVRQHYNVSSDPQQTVVGGLSYGGLAATYAGFRHSDIFGKVLSQSGSFWWKPSFVIGQPVDENEFEWLTHQFAVSPRLPLRFYLDVGIYESGPVFGKGPSMAISNRHMRDVLQAKGYQLHYAEFAGCHEFVGWRGTLADGLIALLGNHE